MKPLTLMCIALIAACGGSSANSGDDGGLGDDGGGQNADGGVSGSGVWVGVPHPTEQVPAAIMPTLPSANDMRDGWPYDPLTLPAPTPTGAAEEYVVSVTGDDGSAGNDGRGTMGAPRRTVPEGAFPAGTKIFVIGANSPYGTIDFEIGDDHDVTFDCTEDEPCWWIGIDGPRLGRRVNISSSAHLLMDGLSFVDTPGGGRPFGQINLSDSSYIAQRNIEVRGNGENSAGGSVISISGVEFLVTYRSKIHTAGTWESNATGLDVHGWRPLYNNRYLWLLESELYHLQADGVQSGNSNNPNEQSETSHYIYIADNLFYENYENAVDNKNSYHVIMSGNRIRDFYPGQGGSGANGTAVILSNNAEGPHTSYHWAINNRISDTSLAIRDSGSEPSERNFSIGNVVWNADAAFLMANNADDRESWWIDNTVFGPTEGIDAFQPGANSSLIVRGNVFVNADEVDTHNAIDSTLSGNILFGTQVAGNWDLEADNLGQDPLLVDPAQGDMTPSAGSPAIGSGTEDPVYGLFETLYGIDIRRDLNGTERPLGSWDRGAVEVP